MHLILVLGDSIKCVNLIDSNLSNGGFNLSLKKKLVDKDIFENNFFILLCMFCFTNLSTY